MRAVRTLTVAILSVLAGTAIAATPTSQSQRVEAIQRHLTTAQSELAAAQSEANALAAEVKPPPSEETPPSQALSVGVNTNSEAKDIAWHLWASNGVRWMRARYPLEARLGTDPAGNEIAEGMRLAKSKGMHGIGQIDTSQSKALPSPVEYTAYALPIIKAAVAVEANAVLELVNEPWEKNGGGAANAKPYGEDVKAVYEAVQAVGVPLAGPGKEGVTLLVAGRNYSGAWMRGLAEGLGAEKAAVNGFTSHPYGSLSTTDSGTNGNHNIATAIQQHRQAVELGFSAFATNDWWITEIGWYIGGSNEAEGEVPDAATQAKRYEELKPIVNTLAAEHWLRGVFAWAQHDGEGHWQITTGLGETAALTASGSAIVALTKP